MTGSDIVFERRGVAGLVTLNRPKALNALTLAMVRELHPQLRAWAEDPEVRHVVVTGAGDRAFCAGGDIRQLYDWGRAADPTFLDFYREEYLLNSYIKRYPKPYVAVMDGITMGGGVGVSVHGSHRIATERLTFAMPETGIGLFPDVGGSYFLPRCPGRLGMFFGLTGHRLKAADACHAGIATHYAESSRLAELVDALARCDDLETCLRDHAGDAGAAPLEADRDRIDRHFAAPGVAAIMQSLADEGDDWCLKTLDILRAKSPTSLEITWRQLARGGELSFEDCMRMEYRIVNRIFTGHDFYEGIRAVVIEKDNRPAWHPAALKNVDAAEIERYFAMVDNELPL